MGISTMTELCRGAGLQASRCIAGCNIAYYRLHKHPLERTVQLERCLWHTLNETV